VIDVFVDELDLAELGFSGVDPEATGRPSYHPAVLLKRYIYGYLNRVQSSRRLEGRHPKLSSSGQLKVVFQKASLNTSIIPSAFHVNLGQALASRV
jgi:transposase